jgi:hypothetical protein
MYYENGGGAGNFPQGSRDDAQGKAPVPTTVQGKKPPPHPLSQKQTKPSAPGLGPNQQPQKEIEAPDFDAVTVDPKTGEQMGEIKAPDFESATVDPKTGDVMGESKEEEPAKEEPKKEPSTADPFEEEPAPKAPEKPKKQERGWGESARGAYQYGKQTGGMIAGGGQAFVQQMAQTPEQAASAVAAHRKRAELDRQAHEAYQKEFDSYQQATRHHEARQKHRQSQAEDKQSQDDVIQDAKDAEKRSKEAMEALSEDSSWADPQQAGQPSQGAPSGFEQQMARQKEQASIPTPFQAQPQTQQQAPATGSQRQADLFRQDIKSFPQLAGFTTFVR